MILTQEETNDIYDVIDSTFYYAKEHKFKDYYEMGVVTRLSSNRNCKFKIKLRKTKYLKRVKLDLTPIFDLIEITDDEFLDSINNSKQ